MIALVAPEAPGQVASPLDSNPPLAPYQSAADRVRAARDAVVRLIRSFDQALLVDDHGTYPGAS